jgi:dipeptidyl aminopeptidase/acylaminoacyl peptidase
MSNSPSQLQKSPISTSMMASQLKLVELGFAGADDDTLVWLESRGGKSVLMAQRGADGPHELCDSLAVRGGVGYGGGELAAGPDGLWLCGADGRLYQLDLEAGAPRAVTPAYGHIASPAPSPDGRHVLYVHHEGQTDLIASIDAQGAQWPSKFVTGGDFYMQPAWHPDGDRVAWVRWDHPNMPWMGSWIEVACVEVSEAGALRLGESPVRVAGAQGVAVQQPIFSPDGRWLAFVSDASSFMHVCVMELETGHVRDLTPGEGEDFATPAWVQGVRTIAWLPDSSGLVAIGLREGVSRLVEVSLSGEVEALPGFDDYASLTQICVSKRGEVAVLGSSAVFSPRVLRWSREQGFKIVRRSSGERVKSSALSLMRPVSWLADDGTRIYGCYYPPVGVSGPAPTILMIHGGPTAQATAAWNVRAQLFATRGFGVLEVNYRGSTGYGRAYMEALQTNWGVHDVEDAVGAASYLVAEGLADPARLIIMGGSAGGYTVFQALVTRPGFFAAGVALYGITDLFSLEAGTHKFESSYNQTLLGPLPERAEVWRERSPIFHADKLVDPVAIFHGAKDRAVPIDQAEAIVTHLKANRRPHLYHVYPDEGHGWRAPETIQHCYDTTLTFLTEHVLMKR